MTDATLTAEPATPPLLGSRRWFLATIFASAFLLFLVQPMIARMALPRVGGAPAVWNSAMLVYQALLLGGYAYADALGRVAPRIQARIHLALLALAALTLPIGLLDWTPPVDGNIFLWVPWLFLASIGPLFFVMSAHAPLLQRWYAVKGHGDPYPLYAASNVGSFLGLIAYPLLVEPLVDVGAQSRGWSVGYLLVVALVAGAALRLPRADVAKAALPTSPAPSWPTMARWALLAAVPSGLILSTTLHLTTDIVAMPLLWVLPLGLYLLSFSVAFASRRTGAEMATRLAPLALLLAACGVAADSVPFPWIMLAAELTGLFLISVALHARMFDERPAPDRLTRFYLVMSLGGVLGGLLCALIAPLVFDWTYEHPLLLLLAALLLPLANPFDRLAAFWASPRARRGALVVGLSLTILLLAPRVVPNGRDIAPVAMAMAALLGVAAIGLRPLYVAAAATVLLIGGGLDKLELSAEPGRMSRSFFGVYSIRDNDSGRLLVHGTTIHGLQNKSTPERTRMATTYYVPGSGVGQAMAWKAGRPGANVSVIGLGAGTLACYRRPGEAWRFYEIDPEIADVARDPQRFTFLSQCAGDTPIVLGDARLTLASAPAGATDLLVVDAFSSDSIPMHLLTREAFDLYRQKLRPDGLLMVHISNRYLDLEPLIAAQAKAGGWAAGIRSYLPTRQEYVDGASGSYWVALSPSPKVMGQLAAKGAPGDWAHLRTRDGLSAWTDGRSTILPLVRW